MDVICHYTGASGLSKSVRDEIAPTIYKHSFELHQETNDTMSLSHYANRISKLARQDISEARLEGEFNQILAECLSEFGISFSPNVNTTLKRMGLSQINSDRPDGVFGHILYDYKAPGDLSTPHKTRNAKKQIERYLNEITGGHPDPKEVREAHPQKGLEVDTCGKWFGYVTDGRTLMYCRSNGRDWQWSDDLPLSENTLMLLVHVYRSLKRKPLTAFLLTEAFGKKSDVARELIAVMCSRLSHPKQKTDMLFREWRRLFEQVSTYRLDQLPSLHLWASENGIVTNNASHLLFAMHSYYSFIVKIITSELLSISPYSRYSVCERIAATTTIDELQDITNQLEDNEYYRRHRISNFLEGDFFSWYTHERSKALAVAIRNVAREFLDFEPISTILRPETKQDLLKELYSSLVDEQIRHDLGEYYTPDWLAQHLLNRVSYYGDLRRTILDPACGSGTFLVEAIARLRERCDEERIPPIETLTKVLENIKGLDLNPLAVISARANYILSIYDLILEHGHDVELPVYLADCINVPVKKTDDSGNKYLEYFLDTELEDFIIEIPWILVSKQVIAKVFQACEESIIRSDDAKRFLRRLRAHREIAPYLSGPTEARISNFYETIESLEARNWNRIWCRIINNNFAPRGFMPFDLIVGNPPWVRWSRLPESYRNRVKAFCNYYGLVSGKGYSGGIESDISTVITFSAADNWLRIGGTVAFLITWTVFKSGSARGFRQGRLPADGGLRIEMIEDLTRIQPFRDATNETSIYVATKVRRSSEAQFRRTDCRIWFPKDGKSRLPAGSSLGDVYQLCEIKQGFACPVNEWGTPLYTGAISRYRQCSFLRGQSDYVSDSHRGTVSDCARVYWVKVLRYSEATDRVLIRSLTREELPRARSIEPIDGMWIEADLLYPLIRGRDVGRYCTQTNGWYQIVPNCHYEDVESEEEFADKYPLTYSYFNNYKQMLRRRSSYKRYQSHLPFYVIYCVGPYSFSRYKVVWMEQQNPAAFRAAVVSNMRKENGLRSRMVPDHKLYFLPCDSANEAHYVCGYLNSKPARGWLGGFLLNKQIGTTIFQFMKVPVYDKDDLSCAAIAQISRKAHKLRRNSRERALLDDKQEKALAGYVRKLCG